VNSQLVTVFGGRDGAHDAAKTLRADGFQQIWIGVIRADASIESANGSGGAKTGRFIIAELDGCTLTQTLRRHGVSAPEAQRIADLLEPEDVVLTVNGSNRPELAARIVEDYGGMILSGKSFVSTNIEWTTGDRRGSKLLGYADPTDNPRTRLGNERLKSDTVPTIREDIFVMSRDGRA